MRTIVEALVSSGNFAMLLRDEAVDIHHKRAAEKLLEKLDRATARIVEMREEKNELL